MTAITDYLDQAQARTDAATPGPWDCGDHDETVVVAPDRYGEADDSYWVADTFAANGNAEFIAAARTDLPATIAALRAVSDLIDGCENVARRHSNPTVRDTHRAIAHDLRHAIATALGVTI